MKWWAFNEQQLDAAVKAYVARVVPKNDSNVEFRRKLAGIMLHEFLDSPEVAAAKMRGDK